MVLLNDPPLERWEGGASLVILYEILDKSDIITLHVPLSKEGEDATWHLFDEERIGRMKRSQILINSSRGPVVDNAALKKALQARSIAGGVLDVWEGEPDLDPELVSLLDISTPHIAGYSADGKANGTSASVRTVSQVLGLPLTDWFPEDIPSPSVPLEFSIDAAGKSRGEVLSEAVLYTYDVMGDSDSLLAGLALFEKLRGDYPVRREPSAFTLNLHGGDPLAVPALEELGFKVNQITDR